MLETQGTTIESATRPMESGETILFADDDHNVRTFSKLILEDSGYNVIEAIDGNDAVEKFKNQGDNIRLVILDVIMPNKGGKEAADEIKALRPNTKILFVSGYNAEILHRERATVHTVDFVAKPFNPDAFLTKVWKMLALTQCSDGN